MIYPTREISSLETVDRVHLFLFEKITHNLADLPHAVLDRLTIHAISGDPLGWDGNNIITMETDLVDYITKILVTSSDKQVAIAIDSISNMILHRSPSYTCQVLQKCSRIQNSAGTEVSPVVALVHCGLHDDTVMNMLSHTATSVLDLHPAISSGHHGLCHLIHKKLSGKILTSKEQFKFSKYYELTNVEEIQQMTDLSSGSTNPAEPNPAANLTFNLTLSENEKEARSKVVLPYLHKPKSSEVSISPSGSAKIFYQPDEADDFDEEDPDDDLDI